MKLSLSVVVLAVGVALRAAAQPVLETFDNGFPGTASVNGWTSPWTYGQITTPVIINTSPLNNSGNYLNFSQNSTFDSALRRTYNGGIPATDTEIIQCLYRVDALSNFSTTNDYVTLTDGAAGDGGSGVNSHFIIRAYGALPGGTPLPPAEWLLYNGLKSREAFSFSNMVDSGMPLEVGDVYAFSINVYPVSLTYDVTISDLTAQTSVTVTNLGSRNNSFGIPNTLIFNSRIGNGANTEQISIDSISVTNTAPPNVSLQIQPVGGSVVLTWPQGTLLEATNVTGPWSTNPAASPYTNQPTGGQMFFRLRVQ